MAKSGWCIEGRHEACRVNFLTFVCSCDCPVDVHGSGTVKPIEQDSTTDMEASAMAQKVSVQTYDDLDGSEGASSVTFGLDGAMYEIDLTDEHQAQLRDALAPYVGAGRRITTAASRGRATVARHANRTGPNPRAVRAWARENGLEVPERGRIPAEITDKYNAANK